jgi:hypothetical protein
MNNLIHYKTTLLETVKPRDLNNRYGSVAKIVILFKERV